MSLQWIDLHVGVQTQTSKYTQKLRHKTNTHYITPSREGRVGRRCSHIFALEEFQMRMRQNYGWSDEIFFHFGSIGAF